METSMLGEALAVEILYFLGGLVAGASAVGAVAVAALALGGRLRQAVAAASALVAALAVFVGGSMSLAGATAGAITGFLPTIPIAVVVVLPVAVLVVSVGRGAWWSARRVAPLLARAVPEIRRVEAFEPR